eukprot:UN22752
MDLDLALMDDEPVATSYVIGFPGTDFKNFNDVKADLNVIPTAMKFSDGNSYKVGSGFGNDTNR